MVGKVQKKEEEEREDGEKRRTQRARMGRVGLEPGTYCMLGEGPQLHATGVV